MIDASPSTLRIAAYNILEGGIGRLDPIAETLVTLQADLIALIEANDPQAVAYLARYTGMHHALAESPTGRFHVALLSRHPIRQMLNLGVKHPALSRAAMLANIEVRGLALRMGVFHLQSGLGRECEDQRLKELEWLLRDLGDGTTPTVLAGDFNTNAPWHPIDVERAEPSVRRRLRADPTLVCHDVVEQLTAAGWAEAYHRAHPDQPAHTFSTGFPSTRLDYIFADHTLADRITGAGVETRGFAPYCSDHFPLYADLKWGN